MSTRRLRSTDKYYANKADYGGSAPSPSPAVGPAPAITADRPDIDLEDLASRVADKLTQHFGDAAPVDGAHAACDVGGELGDDFRLRAEEVELNETAPKKDDEEDDCPY
jgi:hypothetical protein